MIAGSTFVQGTNCTAFDRGESMAPDIYRELARRGRTQRLQLNSKSVPMAVARQGAGAGMIFRGNHAIQKI